MPLISKLPSFEIPDETGKIWTEKDFLGKTSVLYLYPKDNTPGCTRQALTFRDHMKELKKLKIQVVGCSRDTSASHGRFQEKYDLNFPLLSDVDATFIKALKCWKKKVLYGRTSIGIERSTFLVGPDLEILQEWRKVRVDDHMKELFEILKQRSAG